MKYLGSKARVAKHIVPIIQKYIDDNDIKRYWEPFVGGANIIDKINCKFRLGTDIDNIPIVLLDETRRHPERFKLLPDILTREHYNEVRKNKDKYSEWYYSAIMLFGSFNSRIYGGCFGGYAKTKDGKIRNYFQEAINNFKKQLPNLDNIVFGQDSYDVVNSENALIYCDIPYEDSIGYGVKFDYDKFWNWVREQEKNNNIVLVSSYNAPPDFECIWSAELGIHFKDVNLKAVEKLFIRKEFNNEEKNKKKQ